jgi:hypothetical protein
MRVMVIIKADKDSEAGIQPTKQTRGTFAAMGKFNEELVKAGVLLAADGVQPSSKGKRVKIFGAGAHGDRWPIHRDEGTRRGLLAVASEVNGRGGGMA